MVSILTLVMLVAFGLAITQAKAESVKFTVTSYITKTEAIPVPDVEGNILLAGEFDKQGYIKQQQRKIDRQNRRMEQAARRAAKARNRREWERAQRQSERAARKKWEAEQRRDLPLEPIPK